MKYNYKQEQEVNFVGKSLADFVEYYNQNIPASFPRATVGALNKFQIDHPALFDDSKMWTIDKHRRKLMDWLQSYQETV